MYSQPRKTRGVAAPVSRKRRASSELDPQTTMSNMPQRIKTFDFIVSVDFGSSKTAVAYHKHGTSTDQIYTIDDFPGTPQLGFANKQIASELWYPDYAKPLAGPITTHDIRLRFGDEVTRMSAKLDGVSLSEHYPRNTHVAMMKLLLDNSAYAQQAKTELIEDLDNLVALGYIKKRTDVINDFLREVLRVVKDRLMQDHGLTDRNTVEVVFAVPVCWSPSAVRTMTAAVEAAMKEVQLGTDGTQLCHVFVVHEAEAQAMHALRQTRNQLRVGEVFIQADVGGLTTDFGCYTIAMGEPTRLGNEVLQAFGDLVGAGDVNKSFTNFFTRLLRKESYLFNGDMDKLRTIIEADLGPQFENTFKRSFEGPDNPTPYVFRLLGLRSKQGSTYIYDDAIQLTSEDMWTIFKPTVEKIGEMLERAVTDAQSKVTDINKFVLSGGFGDSPCLRAYLRSMVTALNKKFGTSLQVCYAPKNMSATGVATGAILRAIDKTHGPARKPRQSIGIIRHIPIEDAIEGYPADVLRQESRYYKPAGANYIYETIRWILKVNAGLLPSVCTVRFKSDQWFEPNEEDWYITETFYASETCVEDHWKVTHDNNNGKKGLAVVIGVVSFNITHLKDEIRRVLKHRKGQPCNVQIEVGMTVIDRFLEFSAYWNDQLIEGSRQGLGITSAFTPGTQ